MTKKLFASALALALLLACAGCAGRPATLADKPEAPPVQDTDPDANINTDSGGALYTGLYAVGSLSSSASAGEKDGLLQTDVTLVATGLMVGYTLEAAEMLAKDGISAKVINIHTIKPLDEDLIVSAAKETGKVVTIEEHSVIGGLGGAVCEALSEKCPVPVKRIGVQDEYGQSGPAVELLHYYKLDAEGIYGQIKEFLR